MRYFLDTEFFEQPGSIELISIGIVADDGRTYYAENQFFDWDRLELRASLHDGTERWLLKNVKPHMTGVLRTTKQMKEELTKFCRKDNVGQPGGNPEFWGYFCDYDWVVFCWIFGRMLDLPQGFPMYCLDIKQLMKTFGLERSQLPEQVGQEHNALADAQWNRDAFYRIRGLIRTKFTEVTL